MTIVKCVLGALYRGSRETRSVNTHAHAEAMLYAMISSSRRIKTGHGRVGRERRRPLELDGIRRSNDSTIGSNRRELRRRTTLALAKVVYPIGDGLLVTTSFGQFVSWGRRTEANEACLDLGDEDEHDEDGEEAYCSTTVS